MKPRFLYKCKAGLFVISVSRKTVYRNQLKPRFLYKCKAGLFVISVSRKTVYRNQLIRSRFYGLLH